MLCFIALNIELDLKHSAVAHQWQWLLPCVVLWEMQKQAVSLLGSKSSVQSNFCPHPIIATGGAVAFLFQHNIGATMLWLGKNLSNLLHNISPLFYLRFEHDKYPKRTF